MLGVDFEGPDCSIWPDFAVHLEGWTKFQWFSAHWAGCLFQDSDAPEDLSKDFPTASF